VKRRNFLGLAGQSLALVAAAPALVPLATAAPPTMGGLEAARRRAKLSRVLMDYGHVASHPPLVFSNDGRRAYMHEAIRHFNGGLEQAIHRELRLSTPYDLSPAECEPDHTIDVVV